MNRRLIFPLLILVNLVLASIVGVLWEQRVRPLWVGESRYPRVIARVNGHPILLEEWLSTARIAGESTSAERDREVLHQLIAAEVVMQRAVQARKMDAGMAMEAGKVLRFQFRDQADYEKALAAAGLNEDRFQARLARILGADQWLREQATSQPSEEGMQTFYQGNLPAFTFPEVVEARHFVAIFPPNGQPEDMLATADRLKDAVQRLKEGLPFESLIDPLSDDPAKKITSGSLSWFSHERMEPELVQAAFALPIGKISQPVQSRFGFHLLQVTDKKPALEITFSDAKPELEQRLTDDLRRAEIKALVAGEVSRAKVEILADNLR